MPATTPPMTGDEINASIGYAAWVVLRRSTALDPSAPQAVEAWTARHAEREVDVRGLYDTSVMPTEFNKQHVPGFFSGLPDQRWPAAYPFVRSYEWYPLPQAERRWMLSVEGKGLHEVLGVQR